MKYLLDSNIVIRTILGIGESLRERIAACEEGDLATSAIVYAEVALGSVQDRPPVLEKLRAFCEEVPVLDFDTNAASVYATLPFKRASYDRLIAAHSVARGLILITDNEKDFVDIPGLAVENWTR